MVDQQSGTIQQNLYRVLAAVEFLTDRTKEMTEGAKERDKKLDGLDNACRNLAEQVRDLTRRVGDNQEATAVAFRDAKHEQRNNIQVVTGRVEVVDLHLKALDTKHDLIQKSVDTLVTESASTSESVSSLKSQIEALKIPVDQLLSLRRHIYAFGALFASVFAAMWMIGQPVVSWVMEHFLSLWLSTPQHK